MDSDEEGESQRSRALFEEELARKTSELQALTEIGYEAGFTPRTSLARSPPPAARHVRADVVEPPPRPQRETSKRPLTSPEDLQEAVRRRVAGTARTIIPPVAGILSSSVQELRDANVPAGEAPEQSDVSDGGLATWTKLQLVEKLHAHLENVRRASDAKAANGKFRYALEDRRIIGDSASSIMSIFAALNIRMAETELQLEKARSKCKLLEVEATFLQRQQSPVAVTNAQPSFASVLKGPAGKPAASIPLKQGPAVIFYPVDGSDMTTSEATKNALQTAISPGTDGIHIQSVRRVGNAGVVVRTVTESGARKLKEKAPATLKAVDPKERRPLVAIQGLRADHEPEAFLTELYRMNLEEDEAWPRERFMRECRVAFKKGRRDGQRTTIVLECSAALRMKLVGLGTVYVGWDATEVADYIRVTCCNRCQQYGHPEKHCRSKDLVCGKCGETGHRKSECQSATDCCATCRRFRRPEANCHRTAAAECPARAHAEQRMASMIQYE